MKDRPKEISQYDWEKFDQILEPTHAYIYSVKSLGKVKGMNILDLGCGNGYLSVILAKRGANVFGIDISSEAINSAKKMAKINQVENNIQFKVASAYKLEYPDDYFDCIIGQAILHHIQDRRKLVNPLFRVLKSGGRAIFFEAFGESQLLEKIRLMIPVPVAEDDKTHWDEQLRYKDLDVFKDRFIVKYKEFQLFSRIDRIITNKTIIRFIGEFDLFLLKYIPFLRRYARTIVVDLYKS